VMLLVHRWEPSWEIEWGHESVVQLVMR
jgi:hypothetical protein